MLLLINTQTRSQTGTWSEFKHGIGISSWWFNGLYTRQNLFGILTVVQTSLPQGLLHPHSWIRYNLDSRVKKKENTTLYIMHFQVLHSISYPLCHHHWFTTHSTPDTRLISNFSQFSSNGEDLCSLEII